MGKKRVGNHLFLSVQKLFGEVPGTFGEAPVTLGEAPQTLGEAPGTFGEVPQTLGNIPRTFGEFPGTFGEAPQTLGDIPRTFGEAPKTLGEFPRTFGEAPKTFGDIPRTVGDDINQKIYSTIDKMKSNLSHQYIGSILFEVLRKLIFQFKLSYSFIRAELRLSFQQRYFMTNKRSGKLFRLKGRHSLIEYIFF